jgi:AhpD family alkylhydroperoxidase
MTETVSSRVSLSEVGRSQYHAMLELDRVANEAELDPRLRELIKMRASQINGCAYCLDMHARDAIEAGETHERLHVLAGWREATGWFDERERAVLALTEAVTRIGEHGVPDEVYDAAAEHLSEEEVATVLWLTVLINAWNRVAVSSSLPPERP